MSGQTDDAERRVQAELVELERQGIAETYCSLPGWRRPYGSLATLCASINCEVEREGIRDALLDLAGDEPQSFDDLAERLREEWGPATGPEIRGALRTLVGDGALSRTSRGYVRREQS